MTTAGATETTRAVPAAETLSLLVRATFLVRLIALAFAAVLTASDGDPSASSLAFLVALVVTSHLGLQRPGVRAAVVRHPALALPDVVLVCLVPLVVGERSPLLLVGVGTALLVGVLFGLRTSVPLGLALATCFGLPGVAAMDGTLGSAFSYPVVLLSVTASGAAFRRLADQQQRSERQAARARAAAAAAQERLRLARDLHDTVAKSVQGLALTASSLPGWVERDPGRAQSVARELAAGAREAVQVSRSLLTSLRLDDPARPMHEVLDELAGRAEERHGGPVLRRLVPVRSVGPVGRHELVMAAVEALENVSRHAPGSRVALDLHDDGEHVVVSVTDDGPGFADERRRDALAEGRFGLVGLAERMASVGGTAEVRSAPGAGTVVRLRVPRVTPVLARAGDGVLG